MDVNISTCSCYFFYLAFSNLTASEKFETINVALVEKQENSYFKQTLESLENGNEKLINLKVKSLNEAKQLLKDGKIKGYYLVSD